MLTQASSLRLFFALWPDLLTRARIEEAARAFRNSVTASWIKTEKFHLTLVFLGDVETHKLSALKASADRVRATHFCWVVDRAERWRGSGILCLTSTTVPGGLLLLVDRLRESLQTGGFTLDTRPYRPHLTLARKADCRPNLQPAELPLVWQVNSFSLIKSYLDQGESTYEVLRTWPLDEH